MWLRRSISFENLRLVKTIEKEARYANSMQRSYPLIDDFIKQTGFELSKTTHQCILSKEVSPHTVQIVFHARNPALVPEPEPKDEEVIPIIEQMKDQDKAGEPEEEFKPPDLSEFFIVISRNSLRFVIECTTYNSFIKPHTAISS
jgi:hypothetical protein